PCDYNWSAAERTHTFREQRRIWTPLGATSEETADATGSDYITSNPKTAWNNWRTDNAVAIGNLLGVLGHEVVDFHRRTADGAGSTIQSYCYDITGDTSIQDGNTDDINGLINFVRGKDYFNYEPDAGNCVLDKWRSHILGDIYHSQIVQVGPPNANTAFLGQNQEAFFRASNNYGHYIRDHEKRATLLYAGGNDGMLHAFVGCEKDDAPCTGGGIEQWAFIPPFITAKLPKIADNSLNKQDDGGGTNSIFSVDGSPVVHDMYISSMHDCPGELDVCKQWRTILVIPYGRGGAGFSILDVSETEASAGKGPKHLFSVYNDTVHNQVLVADYLGDITSYPYLHRSYTLDGSLEAETANANIRNAADDTARDNLADCQTEATLTAAGQNFIDNGTNGCYEGNTWTWSLETHSKTLSNDGVDEDIQVFLEGELLPKGSFTVADDGATLTV
ncbi:MAG: PilC/PilY family type IV pilus protein, partial [Candidatus Poribacteria bacterium]|nr:PilC/PilY family type IV pilus protein [Candidatus Poribacteria bacterium]